MTEDEMIDGIISSMDISFRKCWEIVKDKESQRAAVHGATNRHHLMTEQQQPSLAVRNMGNCLPLSEPLSSSVKWES